MLPRIQGGIKNMGKLTSLGSWVGATLGHPTAIGRGESAITSFLAMSPNRHQV